MLKFSPMCAIRAPCKINVHLAVGARRQDGFHNIESVFAALDFGDSLVFTREGGDGFWDLAVNVPAGSGGHFPVLPGELVGADNLVSRAVALFRAKTGFNAGLRCVLDKRTPVGAGLGGGSSDAASTLLALDCLADTRLSPAELRQMAAGLGSDVPFFLLGGAALVSGRGESLEALPPPAARPVLLVKPPFRSATGEAFRLLDEFRESPSFQEKNVTKNTARKGSVVLPPHILKEFWARNPNEWPFFNDFLSCLPEFEIYSGILGLLGDSGALFSGLSGSGSCCFGIFEDKKTMLIAEKAVKSSKNTQIFTIGTFFLASRAIPVLE